MKLSKQEVLTVPNAVTATRLLLSPYFARKLYENPRKWWFPSVILAATDTEGILARLGDGTKNPDGTVKQPGNERLARLGFRGSEPGRLLDPITDKVLAPSLLAWASPSGSYQSLWGL